jgi:hypothetical protein
MIDPSGRAEKRRGRERQPWAAGEAIGDAAPRPVLCSMDEAGLQRIALDIPADAYENGGLVDWRRFEAPLIDGPVAACMAALMQPHRMGSRDPMHQSRKVVRARLRQHEVPVIRQDAVAQELGRMALEAVAQNGKESAIITRRAEKRLLSHRSIQHVKKCTGSTMTGTSGHPNLSLVMTDALDRARAMPGFSRADLSLEKGDLWKTNPSPVWGSSSPVADQIWMR